MSKIRGLYQKVFGLKLISNHGPLQNLRFVNIRLENQLGR